MSETTISGGGISLDDVRAKLVYFPAGDTDVRLSWSVVIRTTDHRHWWQLVAAGTAMALLVTAFSLFTDALRDALDPKLKGLKGH